MDLVKELAAKKTIQKDLVNQVNLLEEQKAMLSIEAIRLDGDIRTLELLIKEGGKDEPDRDKSKD